MSRSAEFGTGVSSARPDMVEEAPIDQPTEPWAGPSEAEWAREERYSKAN